jgi:hypothetical protein
MKRFLLAFSLLIFSFIVTAQITWNGGGDGISWNDPNNWAGNILPTSADNILLDNSVVPGSYTVNLPGGAVTVIINSLTITPSGTNTISLILPNTNFNNPGFSVTGTGDALVLNNGAILKNSSGGSAGTGIAITNTFRINNGGKYIHNTGRGNAAIVSQLSTVAGTESGEFEYDVPLGSYTVSLNGRTYGNLTFSAFANGGTATYVGNGGTVLNVNGNLQINTGVALNNSMSADFVIHKNCNQAPSSAFILQSSTNNNFIKVQGNLISQGTITETGSGLPVLELNGSTSQNVSVSGSITNSIELKMNNSAGAVLNAPLTLPYKLTLTAGNITTTPGNILTIIDGATCSGGSLNSFINGPMKKTGNDNFSFPVGTGSIYAPITITNVLNEATNDEFTAEYIRGNPQSVHGTTYQPPINHISYVEYWILDRNPGSIATKKISLAVNFTSFCYDLSKTYVSRFDGTQWTYEGSTNVAGPTSPPYVTGTVTSVNTISSFIPVPNAFTLSTDLSFAGNPLPITLISFDATKLTNTRSSVNWELAACCSAVAKFEIQRAGADKNFATIGSVRGSATNTLYNYTDNGLNRGINYYRLKMIDEDGKTTYSRIVAVINDLDGLLLTSLIPGIINNEAALTITSSKEQKIDLLILDIQGRVMQKQNYTVRTGKTSIQLSVSRLAAGVYQLIGISPEEKTNGIRFIKQ